MENNDVAKKYTCIRPTVIQQAKITVGDEVELFESQARPLKNGGFITFDEDAAKCIQKLVKGDSEPDMNAEVEMPEVSEAIEAVNEITSSENDTRDQTVSSSAFLLQNKAVGYETGD